MMPQMPAYYREELRPYLAYLQRYMHGIHTPPSLAHAQRL